MVKIEKSEDGKFQVCFEDTILFPEGGGQNSDYGTIIKGDTKLEVKNVFRRGDEAVHDILMPELPLAVGDEVIQQIDWVRRFENMQRHSGQHLLSNIFYNEFKFTTKAAGLGEITTYIDLETKDCKPEQAQKVEEIANECIKNHVQIKIEYAEKDDPDMIELIKRAPKEVPKDVSGPVRIIKIDGVGLNPCCGTHVSDLSQLQLLKILSAEKKKDKVRVTFVVGKQILKYLEEVFQREVAVTQLLHAPAEEHIDYIKKIQAKSKSTQKTIAKVSKDLAYIEAARINDLEADFFILQRNDGLDFSFIATLQKGLKLKNSDMFLMIVLSEGFDSTNGIVAMQGSDVKHLKEPVFEMLGGQPNEKDGKAQGKVTQLNKMKDCKILVENYFKKKAGCENEA